VRFDRQDRKTESCVPKTTGSVDRATRANRARPNEVTTGNKENNATGEWDLPRFRGGLRAWDQGIWSEGFLAANSKWNFNDISVRSFILTGAPAESNA